MVCATRGLVARRERKRNGIHPPLWLTPSTTPFPLTLEKLVWLPKMFIPAKSLMQAKINVFGSGRSCPPKLLFSPTAPTSPLQNGVPWRNGVSSSRFVASRGGSRGPVAASPWRRRWVAFLFLHCLSSPALYLLPVAGCQPAVATAATAYSGLCQIDPGVVSGVRRHIWQGQCKRVWCKCIGANPVGVPWVRHPPPMIVVFIA